MTDTLSTKLSLLQIHRSNEEYLQSNLQNEAGGDSDNVAINENDNVTITADDNNIINEEGIDIETLRGNGNGNLDNDVLGVNYDAIKKLFQFAIYHNLPPPLYKIKRCDQDGCYVVSCEMYNVTNEGRNVCKEEAARAAAYFLLERLSSIINSEKATQNIQNLTKKLKRHYGNFRYEIFKADPYIMHINFQNGIDLTVLANATTEENATVKLFTNVFNILKNWYDNTEF